MIIFEASNIYTHLHNVIRVPYFNPRLVRLHQLSHIRLAALIKYANGRAWRERYSLSTFYVKNGLDIELDIYLSVSMQSINGGLNKELRRDDVFI